MHSTHKTNFIISNQNSIGKSQMDRGRETGREKDEMKED